MDCPCCPPTAECIARESRFDLSIALTVPITRRCARPSLVAAHVLKLPGASAAIRRDRSSYAAQLRTAIVLEEMRASTAAIIV